MTTGSTCGPRAASSTLAQPTYRRRPQRSGGSCTWCNRCSGFPAAAHGPSPPSGCPWPSSRWRARTFWLAPSSRQARAALVVVVVLAFPSFARLSASFMTDVPAFALVMLCLLLGTWWLRNDDKRVLVLSLVAGIFAVSIRQFALAAPTRRPGRFLGQEPPGRPVLSDSRDNHPGGRARGRLAHCRVDARPCRIRAAGARTALDPCADLRDPLSGPSAGRGVGDGVEAQDVQHRADPRRGRASSCFIAALVSGASRREPLDTRVGLAPTSSLQASAIRSSALARRSSLASWCCSRRSSWRPWL